MDKTRRACNIFGLLISTAASQAVEHLSTLSRPAGTRLNVCSVVYLLFWIYSLCITWLNMFICLYVCLLLVVISVICV